MNRYQTVLDWINTLDCPVEMQIVRACRPIYLHYEYLFDNRSAWLIFLLSKISRRLAIEVGTSFWHFLGERYTVFSAPWYRMI